MKISQVEEMLKRARERHGDIECTMEGTYLPEGYSANGRDTMPDVFETTVCSCYLREGGNWDNGSERLMIQWQV